MEKFFDRYESTGEIKAHQKRHKKIQEGIKEYERKIDNLVDMRIEGTISKERLKPKMEEFEGTVKSLNDLLTRYDKYFQVINDKEAVLELVESTVKGMKKKLTDEQKKQVIHSLVEQISIVWDGEEMKHDINISYLIGRLTQFQLGTDVELRYKKNGWRLDRNKKIVGDIQIFKNLQEELELPEIAHFQIKSVFKE